MMDCTNAEVRDLLPDYAAGRLTAAEHELVERHLAGCADCAAELSLVRAAVRALGGTPAVDVARIVAALPAPPRRATPGVVPIESRRRAAPVRTWTSPRRVAAIAATVVGAVGLALFGSDRPRSTTGVDVPRVATGAEAAGGAGAPVDPTAERGREATAASAELSLAAGVSELSDESLRTLLGAIDELDDSAPSEPAEALPVMTGLDEESGV